MLAFAPVILSNSGEPEYSKRFDLNASYTIDIDDVLMFAPVILDTCTPS